MDEEGIVAAVSYYAGVLVTLAFRVFVTCLVAIILGLTFISTRKRRKRKVPDEDGKEEQGGNMNDYLDSILQSSQEHIKRLNADPLSLPDADKELHKKVLFFDLNGSLQTRQGKLEGLSSIHRAGDATLELNSLTAITVKATVGLDNVNFTSESVVRFRNVVRNVFLGATIKYLKATVVVEFPFLGGGKPEAKELIVEEIGRISLDIKKLGLWSPVIQAMGFVLLNIFKDDIAEKLSEPLMMSINELVADMKMPSLLL